MVASSVSFDGLYPNLEEVQGLRSKVMSLAGRGLSDIAATLALSENTLKTHFSRIYSKTGVHRQAELVSLMAAISPP
jgi:DNA-binding CsgD family transcriptional regulator